MTAHTIDIPPAATSPSRAEAEAAVRLLLAYLGEDPAREGLADTPKRFIDAYEEFLSGYRDDPATVLSRTFEDVQNYNEIVLMRNIRFVSHCEHHLQPMVGAAHVAYIPSTKVVGISKLARVVDIFAKRLQSQETLTNQIADAIDAALEPRGVAILIEAEHFCISTRGVQKEEASCTTIALKGEFQNDKALEERFFRLIGR